MINSQPEAPRFSAQPCFVVAHVQSLQSISRTLSPEIIAMIVFAFGPALLCRGLIRGTRVDGLGNGLFYDTDKSLG